MGNLQPPLTRGDRTENFCLPMTDGKPWTLYNGVRGFRNVLLLYRKNDDENRAVVNGFAKTFDALQALKVDVFAVSTETVEANARIASETSLPFTLLADPNDEVVAAYSQMIGIQTGELICLLLDENQRVLERFAPSDEPISTETRTLAERTLAFFQREPPDEGIVLSGRVAPVLIIPNVLDQATCRMLIDHWETHGHEQGKVHSTVDGKESTSIDVGMKERQHHPILDDAVHNKVAAIVSRRIAPELHKAFHLRRFRCSRFIIACYDADQGGYFRVHRDNWSPQVQDRLFALTLNLNSEYEGGELRFPEYGASRYKPETGSALLFSCSHLHEATSVTKGRRFVLLSMLR